MSLWCMYYFILFLQSLRHLCSIIPGRDDIETFRLKMILRLLQIPSFSGKMNALNEVINIHYYYYYYYY